jgi:hypothetical protein
MEVELAQQSPWQADMISFVHLACCFAWQPSLA